MLKKVSASSIALAAIPTVVSAETHDRSSEAVTQILESPNVQSIKNEIGDFEITEVLEEEIEYEGSVLRSVKADTDRGTLFYAETESGVTEARFTLEDLSGSPALADTLSIDDSSAVSDVVVIGHESSTDVFRSATNKEAAQLRRAIRGNGGPNEGNSSANGDSSDANNGGNDVFNAIYDAEIDGFRVVTQVNDTVRQYQIGANGQEISTATVSVEEPEMGVQSCWWDCSECAAWAIGKGVCYWSCAKTMGATCMICIVDSGVNLAWSCTVCFNNCF